MSRIYFHTKDDVAELHGSERAYMGNLISKITCGIMSSMATSFGMEDGAAILKHIPKDCYLHEVNSYQLPEAFRTWLSVGFEDCLLLDGNKVDTFSLLLNTALVIGSDPLKLCAKIHGQCEIHCYIMPENIEWFIGIIQQGLRMKIFREKIRGYSTGWNEVISLLQQTKDSPVVLSYSVCDRFPNPHVAGWEVHGDDWYGLSSAEQWNLAMPKLIESESSLEIAPSNWNTFYFDGGTTAFDFLNYSCEADIEVEK